MTAMTTRRPAISARDGLAHPRPATLPYVAVMGEKWSDTAQGKRFRRRAILWVSASFVLPPLLASSLLGLFL